MDKDVVVNMEVFLKEADRIMEERDENYNAIHNVREYFPKGWDSAYTYINEGLLRLDNMYSDKNHNPREVEDKWRDLFNYVRIAHAVMTVESDQVGS